MEVYGFLRYGKYCELRNSGPGDPIDDLDAIAKFTINVTKQTVIGLKVVTMLSGNL